MTAHNQFEIQLQNFQNEANNVARYVYTDFSIKHAASKSLNLLFRLNHTPTFWNTTSAALQTAAYISLGRIFDKKSCYNIDQLIRSAESNIDLFQRAALAKRKCEIARGTPLWLDQYLNEAYYPNPKDFTEIKKKIAKYRITYEKGFKPARNKCIAHREKHHRDEVNALFGLGKVKDLWQLTTFLLQLHQVLWELYHNGNKPKFRPIRYSISSLYRKANGTPEHEYIVGETKKLMKFLEYATQNNNPAKKKVIP